MGLDETGYMALSRLPGALLKFLPVLGDNLQALLGVALAKRPKRFFPASGYAKFCRRWKKRFSESQSRWFGGEALPFDRILSTERIQRVFAKHPGVVGRARSRLDRDDGWVVFQPGAARRRGGLVSSGAGAGGHLMPA